MSKMPKQKSIPLTTRLPVELYDAVRQRAADDQMELADGVREALRRYARLPKSAVAVKQGRPPAT